MLFCSNCLECELTLAGSNIGINFAANLLVRDQSCTVYSKMMFQLTRNESFECSCLDVSSSRNADLVPLDLLLSYRRTSSSHFKSCGKILQFAPIWNQDVSQKSSAHSSSQRIPEMELQERYRSFHFLSRPISATRTCSLFPAHRQLVRHPADRTVEKVRLDLPPS